MTYQHLGVEEREEIQQGLWQKESIRSIAERLERSPASISREIRRNQTPIKEQYSPRLADIRAQVNRKSRGRKDRLKNETIRPVCRRTFEERLAARTGRRAHGNSRRRFDFARSDISIHRRPSASKRYRLDESEQRRSSTISETSAQKKRAKKGMRKGERIFKPKGPSIDDRPSIVDLRSRVGDWEGDTIASKNYGTGLNSLAERTSGLLLLTKPKAKTAEATREVVCRRLDGLPVHTLTINNGPENQEWRETEEMIKAPVYFAHPYCSGERGTNENTNGLVRWYEPKKTDFTQVSEEEIAAVEYALNTRPKKRLGYRTPLEVFTQGVALQC